jgi:hypothetical protein
MPVPEGRVSVTGNEDLLRTVEETGVETELEIGATVAVP